MKGYKLDLLTLLISLFILAACNNPDEIGLDVDPTNSIGTSVDSSATVDAITVPEDKVDTRLIGEHPIGYMIDPYLGITQAAVGVSLNLPKDSLKFGTNAVLDSAVLVLRYSGNFYGDSLNTAYNFSVHQLSQKLDGTKAHNNDVAIPFNNTQVGAKTINKINLKDSIKVTQIVKGKKDTVLKVPPQIRIPISASFINTNFLNANAANFYTSKEFIDYIKGLYIKVDPPAGSSVGGVPFFDFSTGASKLELYYRNVNATIDTTYLTFTINNNLTPVLANFTQNYAGTEVEAQLNIPGTAYTRTFVQALSGVRTKITFPDLNKFKQLGNIVVNKAVLEVRAENGTTSAPFQPAPRLMLYRTDIAAQKQPMPDMSPNDIRSVGMDLFGGRFNSKTNTYSFVLTAYIQDLLIGKSKQYATYLAVVDQNVNDIGTAINPMSNIASRTVLGSGKNASRPMRLKIFYTKLNN
ncbi:MAG: hypothetical protein RLZ47_156 [Bacteroidota bacterium]|jgi:hypothetical protein